MVIAKHVILSEVEESPVFSSIVLEAETQQTHLRGYIVGFEEDSA